MSKYDYQFELSEASEFDFPPEWTAEPLEGLLSSSLFKGKSWQKDSSDVLGRKRSEHFGSHKSSPGKTTCGFLVTLFVDTQDPKVLAIIAKLEECAGKDGTDWYVPKVLGNFLYVDVHFNTFDSDIFFKRK